MSPSNAPHIYTPKKSKPVQTSSTLPHEDILTQAFVNLDMMEADHKHKVDKVVEGSSNDKTESVLEKNLRLSTTSPVDLALHDATRALVDFETKDPVGNALKGGLPKDLDEVVLNTKEVQQLQRKLDKKQNLELDSLYVQLLRCPADNHLEQYMPCTRQTPKPSRIHLELRNTIAIKTAKATKEARREVFSKYCANGELEHVMARFDEITSQCLADTKLVSKKLAKAPEVNQAADAASKGLDGRLGKLARKDADAETLEGLGEKVKDARAKMLAAQYKAQQDKKAKKAEERRANLEKLSAKASGKTDESTDKHNGIH